MKRRSKRLGYCFAGLAVVFVLAVLAEHLRGERALNARLKALADKGEVLSLPELKPKRPASDQNLFAAQR